MGLHDDDLRPARLLALQPHGGEVRSVNNQACPFCGDPHPAFAKDPDKLEEDPDELEEDEEEYEDEEEEYPYPGCEHWIGRYDTDGGYHNNPDWYAGMGDEPGDYYSGYLGFLDGLDLPACVDENEESPTAEALEAAFGDQLALAQAVYANGWESPGTPRTLFDALVDTVGIKTVELWGGSGPMDSWISYDYYAPNPEAILDRLRRDAKAVKDGVRALRA
jgi:hypothetical protein